MLARTLNKSRFGPQTSGLKPEARSLKPDIVTLDLRPADRRLAAADVIDPVKIALPYRCAMHERRTVGKDDGIDHFAGHHVALEECAHVRVRLPQIFCVGRLDADAVRPISHRGNRMFHDPGFRIDTINHPARWHRHPELAVLSLLAMRSGPRRGRPWISRDRAAASNAEAVRGGLPAVLSRRHRSAASAPSSAAAASARTVASSSATG